MALATEAADGFLTPEEKQRQRQAMQQREAEAARARRRDSDNEEDTEDDEDEDEDGTPAGRRGLRSGQQVQQNVVTKNLNKAVRKTEEVG